MSIKLFENWKEEYDDDSFNDFIKGLDEYTDEEKIKKFDTLYNMALRSLNDYIDSQRFEYDEDEKQYLWEEVMKLLSYNNRDFWNFFNNIK